MTAKPGKVLIVDDEPFIRQLLRRTVEREGFAVMEAEDGEAAIQLFQDHAFDFVISDIKMPKMDGMELLKAIKADFPNTQVLLITAYSGEYSPQDIIEAGADYFISKPFKNLEIRQTLAALRTRTGKQNLRARYAKTN